MSGHSKWKTIQHKKGAADAKRGKIFSKMAKELMVVAKAGGGSPDTNTALRTMIQRCKAVSMPNADRALENGALKRFPFEARPLRRIYQFDQSRGVKGFPKRPEDALKTAK